MVDIIGAALGLLTELTARPAAERIRHSEALIRARKKLGLSHGRLPDDARQLYAYVLVEHCYGMPKEALAFFGDPIVRDAFVRAYRAGDWSVLRAAAAEVWARGEETGEFGRPDYNLPREVDGLIDLYLRLVSDSRTPVEVRIDQKLDQVLEKIERTQASEEIHRQELDPWRAAATPVQRLGTDMRDWFGAVDYRIIRELEVDDADAFAWLVSVPSLHRRVDVVVLGVDGELNIGDMTRLSALVHSAGAEQGWCVAPRRISPAAARIAKDSGDKLYSFTFDTLLDLDAKFESYLDWLDAEVNRQQIDTHYVELSCRKDEVDPLTGETVATNQFPARDGGLEFYVQSWLEDPSKEHLSLLGEFGTGKTWFALHFAWRQAKLWRKAKSEGRPRPRLPLIVPLRDYAKATTAEALLSQFLFRRHQLCSRYEAFQQLNRMGKLLIIFDGFDEMAAKVDRQAMANNFWELASVVETGSKVLLSCRTEHFPHARAGRELLSARVRASTERLTGEAPQFEIVEVEPFDDEQIRMVLGNRLTDPGTVERIMGTPALLELMRRPVMSELLLEALPDIGTNENVNMTHVYLYAVRAKINRDITAERTFTSLADKLYFLCEVSWEMLATNNLSLNYRAFPDRLRACFAQEVQAEKDLDYWQHDMRAQTMLVRNGEGDYTPAHKSLIEFFAAYRLAAQLGVLDGEFLLLMQSDVDGPEIRWSEYGNRLPLGRFTAEPFETLAATFGSETASMTVLEFVRTMMEECADSRDRLIAIAHLTRDRAPSASGGLGGNAVNLLGLSGDDLRDADLSGCDLTGMNPPPDDLPTSLLEGASLAGTELREARFAGLSCLNIDFTGAHMQDLGPLEGFEIPVLSIGCLPTGEIGLASPFELRLWSDAGFGVEDPAITALQPDREVTWIRLLPSNRLLEYGSDGHVLVDPASGSHLALSLRCADSVKWQGRDVLIGYQRRGDALSILDAASVELISSLPSPPDIYDRLGMTASGVLFHFGFLLATFEPSECRWQEHDWDAPNGAFGSFADGGLFLVYSSDGERDFVEVGGVPIWIAMGMKAHALSHSPATRQVLVSTANTIVAWPYEGDPLWTVPTAGTVRRMAVHPDGETFVALTQHGEITRRSLRDGSVLRRISINPFLKGAKVSRDCGLDLEILESMAVAGAVIVEPNPPSAQA